MKQTAKTHQFFRTIILLSQGRYLSTAELSQELGVELRTAYRYITDIEESPFFELERRVKRYRISSSSLFWANVANKLFLTDDEAVALWEYLEDLDTQDEKLLSLQRKVKTIVGNRVSSKVKDANEILNENINAVRFAVENQRLCMLRGYNSVRSNTRKDRLVEPFCFLGSKNDVRCYELSSKMNKTFKISRCESVEVMDVNWQFEKRHAEMFTDIFHFSDEKKTRVRLLLGNRAKTILLEEHPEARAYIIPHPDGRWMLDAEYCSMLGVGRFYLGLFEDIEIVDSPEFQHYLTERVKTLTNVITNQGQEEEK